MVDSNYPNLDLEYKSSQKMILVEFCEKWEIELNNNARKRFKILIFFMWNNYSSKIARMFSCGFI